MQASASSLIGRTLAGGVTLDAFLGEGGFARIYQGRRGTPPVEVAVKVLHSEYHSDAVFLRRFEREAKTAISVAHPNAVQILEYGIHEGLAFIVMELVRGESLFDVLKREGRLSQRRAVKIVAQICDALDAAHGQGIVHRDVKPENIMLLGDPSDSVGEWVKVLDFGIAKLLFERAADDLADDSPDSGRLELTGLGTVLGTPEYMAPEQARGDAIDGRCDVYSCGVLLYQLVTGQLPFSGVTPAHTVILHLQQPPRPPTTVAPDVHPELERVILEAMSKSPDARQQSADELREQLNRLSKVVPATPGSLPPEAALGVAPTVNLAATPANRPGLTERLIAAESNQGDSPPAAHAPKRTVVPIAATGAARDSRGGATSSAPVAERPDSARPSSAALPASLRPSPRKGSRPVSRVLIAIAFAAFVALATFGTLLLIAGR